MATVCSPVTLPTFDDFKFQLQDIHMQFGINFEGFSLPTLPTPLYADLKCPDMNINDMACQMVLAQFLEWIKAVIDPIMSVVGAIPWPTIPTIGITLPDIPSFDFNSLALSLRASFPDLSAFSVPLLPTPLLATMNVPSFEITTKIQTLIRNYCAALVTMVKSLFQKVLDKFNPRPFSMGFVMPTIPDLPTDFNALIAPLLAQFSVPDIPTLRLQYPNIQLPDMFMSLVPPGFPGIDLSIPSPFFGQLTSPDIELVEMCKNYYQALVMYCAKKIDEFCNIIKSVIPFPAFPKLCFDVPTVTA